MNPLLRFCNVSFGYGGLDVIQSANFDLQAGSCTALIGPNGAGKTTILRLAAGTLQCRSGNVILNDVPLRKLALRKVARTVALVPQQLDVPFQFTVREVVEQGRPGPGSRGCDRVATENLQRTERGRASAREDCAGPRAGTEAAAVG